MLKPHRTWGSNICTRATAIPQVTLFPRNDVKHCGDNEECTEPHAIDPCCYFFPSIVGKSVEKGTAHNCRNNEELKQNQKKAINSTHSKCSYHPLNCNSRAECCSTPQRNIHAHLTAASQLEGVFHLVVHQHTGVEIWQCLRQWSHTCLWQMHSYMGLEYATCSSWNDRLSYSHFASSS